MSTEPDWERSTEHGTRWRALLDRALLGRDDDSEHEPPGRRSVSGQPTSGQPVSGHPEPGVYGSGHAVSGHREPGVYGSGQPTSGQYASGQPTSGQYASGQYASGQYASGQYGSGQPTSGQYVPESRTRANVEVRPPGYPGEIEWRQPRRDDAAAQAVTVLRRELGRPRVLAFANPKGGVHKTTATALAAAAIGSVRGRGVLAWDDNELRGTLGLRAGSARHARTIRHLVADLAEVEAHSGTELIELIDDYLRHASDGTYDVLAGEESPKFAQRLDKYTVRRLLDLLRRTHEVLCVDTGNNVESPNWQTVLQAADQLVVTTVPREDAAFTADWMLDLLADIGLRQLAADAVTLLSCATPGHQPLLDDLRAHFASRTRAVVVVPYDPALESGSAIEPAMLQPATRQAWLQACAVIMEPLTRPGSGYR